MPRVTSKSASDVGTDTPGHLPAIGTDSYSKPAQQAPELQPRNWQPGLAWQAPTAQVDAVSSVPFCLKRLSQLIAVAETRRLKEDVEDAVQQFKAR